MVDNDAEAARRRAGQHIRAAYQEITKAMIELSSVGEHAAVDRLRTGRNFVDGAILSTVVAPKNINGSYSKDWQ